MSLINHAVITVIVFCTIAHSAEAFNASESLWKQYTTMYPTGLNLVFQAEETLQEAHRQANVDHFNTRKFGCTDYDNGREIATIFRRSGMSTLLVDSEEDCMCFSTQSMPSALATPALEMLDFSTSVSGALKVHPTLYNLVESTDEELLSIINSFQAEGVHLSCHFLLVHSDRMFLNKEEAASNTAEENEEVLNDALRGLRNPSFPDNFERFFWTAQETHDFFDTADLSDPLLEQDAERSMQWDKFALFFDGMNTPDYVCNFSSMIDSANIRQNEIRLPLNGLFAAPTDLMTIRACVAYLVSYLALNQDAQFLALQNSPVLHNYRARSITQSTLLGNDATTSPYTAAGLLGDNQIGAVADTGVDSNSCYFYDSQGQVQATSIYKAKFDMSYRKIIQYSYVPKYADTSDAVDGHGTHVSSTMLGSRTAIATLTTPGQYDGMAPNAKLAFVDMSTGGDGLVDPGAVAILSPGYSAGSRVHTNSWGSTYSSQNGYYYGADADAFLYEHVDMVLFYSAGNEGGGNKPTITMDASSKNVIAVGSSQSSGGDPSNIAWYSSIGPAYDGRYKPDLIAPGDSLMSAKSNGQQGKSCETIFKTGTSMASPCAAGNALLIRQYFQDPDKKFWLAVCSPLYPSCASFTPSGVLIKALLLHSGSAMALYNGGGSDDVPLGAAPDSYQGYGRVTLSNALPLKGTYTTFDLFVDDQVQLGEYSTVKYNVIITKKRQGFLKVTLSWYDPPSIEGTTAKALLHDLDLLVKAPDGTTTYYGNGGSSVDTINTNEQVFLADVSRGTYQIKISSKALPVSGSQPFSVVITSNGYVQQ